MSRNSTRVWLAAAENGSFPGGKVGGVGDVIRDLPGALANNGCEVRVITPSHGSFHKLGGSHLHRSVTVTFNGDQCEAELYQLPSAQPGISQFVIHHEILAPGKAGQIYHDDGSGAPFATDSGKYSFFCAALAAWTNSSEAPPEVLHLHDWHTGLVPLFRQSTGKALDKAWIVFTMHNIAYQGVRPLNGPYASMQQWFPDMPYQVSDLKDPVYTDCVNFMATAIRLADTLNTVSPGYAQEILQPAQPGKGFNGGAGLESLLKLAADDGRLSGILNGCIYPETDATQYNWQSMQEMIAGESRLLGNSGVARERLKSFASARPKHILLNIGRAVDQKVALFLEPAGPHPTALDAILKELGNDSLFIILGSGEQKYEEALLEIAKRHQNLLYLRGYAEGLSEPLYSACDLFVMPSSFEPCGISQMLAMRAGQPCVVHGVGGLKDTVSDGVTGFVFEGNSPRQQAEALVAAVQRAIKMREQDDAAWQSMRSAAAAERFDWQRTARAYIEGPYRRG